GGFGADTIRRLRLAQRFIGAVNSASVPHEADKLPETLRIGLASLHDGGDLFHGTTGHANECADLIDGSGRLRNFRTLTASAHPFFRCGTFARFISASDCINL